MSDPSASELREQWRSNSAAVEIARASRPPRGTQGGRTRTAPVGGAGLKPLVESTDLDHQEDRLSPRCSHILTLDDSSGQLAELADRVLAFGVEPLVVQTLEEAHHVLEQSSLPIYGALLSTDFETADLKGDLRALRRVATRSALCFVAVGKPPDRRARRRLRAAGVRLALWEPFDEGALRFQVNQAISGDPIDQRSDLRVPTHLKATVIIGERTKETVVYSMSLAGAFLETPRASMDQSQFEIEIRLPTGLIRMRAQVIYPNVPGNLQRPNLPLGMGVLFDGASKEDSKALRSYVRERSAGFEV